MTVGFPPSALRLPHRLHGCLVYDALRCRRRVQGWKRILCCFLYPLQIIVQRLAKKLFLGCVGRPPTPKDESRNLKKFLAGICMMFCLDDKKVEEHGLINANNLQALRKLEPVSRGEHQRERTSAF